MLRLYIAIAIVTASAFAQTSDVIAPALLSFSFSPLSIDTRSGPQNLAFTANLSDDLSGVRNADVVLNGPRGQSQIVPLTLTAGTPFLGTYSASYSFPQFAATGSWRVQAVRMTDVVGNNVRIFDTTLVSRGINISFTVVSDDDISPPLIQSLQFEPSAINVSNAPAEVTMRMSVSDEQAGLAFDTSPAGCNCTYNFLTFRSPSGNQSRLVSNSAFRLIFGTRNNGVWEGKFTMPRYSESGTWSVESIHLIDFLNNDLLAGAASLAAAGLPTGFTVSSNPADSVKPTLSGLTFTPATIDTALSSQTVTVTFVVQDNLSGINFARDLPCPCPILGVELRSPSGSQRVVSTHQPFTRIAGTNLNGTWTGSVVLQRFAEVGTWNVDLYIKDQALNETRLSADQLKASGLRSGLVVISPSHVEDGKEDSSGGPVMDQVFGSLAKLTIPPNALAGETSIAIDVLGAPPNIPIPQGFSTPVSRFVNVDLVPHPTAPIGQPGYTLTIPLINPLPAGMMLELFRLDPISGILVPARSVTAAPVRGTVDPTGLTATFTGIASFSTVVALVATSIKPGDVNNDGVINCADVSIVRTAFGKRTGQANFDARADVNNDGVVNISDLSFVLRQLPVGLTCQ